MESKFKYSYILIVILSSLIFSCSEKDDYYAYSQTNSGTVIIDRVSGNHYIKMDEQYFGTVYPVGGIPALPNHEWMTGDRIVVDFYLLDEEDMGHIKPYNYKIQIVWAGLIPLQYPVAVSSENADKFGNDPFFENTQYISTFWINDNYLSVIPFFYYADYSKHEISLVTYNIEEFKLCGDTINFELRHNAHNDEKSVLTPPSIFSFRLDELDAGMQQTGKDVIVISIKLPITSEEKSSTIDSYITKELLYHKQIK